MWSAFVSFRKRTMLALYRRATFSSTRSIESSKKGMGEFGKGKKRNKYTDKSGGLADEIASWPKLPINAPPLYDMSELIPLPGKDYDDEVVEVLREASADLEANAAESVELEPMTAGPGTELCLEWVSHFVLLPGLEQNSPMNRKAEARLHVRDLQRVYGLEDKGLAHIVCLLGKRYDAVSGKLRLVCERYPMREDNRKYIVKMIHDLVREGRRFASEDKETMHPPLEGDLA